MAGGFTGVLASHFGISFLLLVLATSVLPFVEALNVSPNRVASHSEIMPLSDADDTDGGDGDIFPCGDEKFVFESFFPAKLDVMSFLGYGGTSIVALVCSTPIEHFDDERVDEDISAERLRVRMRSHSEDAAQQDKDSKKATVAASSLARTLAASRSLPKDLNLISDAELPLSASSEKPVRWMDAKEASREDIHVGQPIPRCASSGSSLSSMLAASQEIAASSFDEMVTGATPEIFVVKIMHKARVKRAGLKRSVERERAALQVCNSPFVCSMHGAFQDDRWMYLLLEPVPAGDLSGLLANRVVMFEDEAKFYVGCVLLALQHLHEHKFACLDVKPENLFLDQWGYVKLGDLGIAKEVKSIGGNEKWELVGTPEYMSPEVVCGEVRARGVAGVSGPDLWATGILIFELLVGETPFASSAAEETLRMISDVARAEKRLRRQRKRVKSRMSTLSLDESIDEDNGEDKSHIHFPTRSASSDAQDLVQRLLHPDPTLRIGCRLTRDRANLGAFAAMESTLGFAALTGICYARKRCMPRLFRTRKVFQNRFVPLLPVCKEPSM